MGLDVEDRAAWAVRRACQQVRVGTGLEVPVRLWDGTELGDGPFRLVLHAPWSLRAMLVPPTDLNAGEAYAHDDVDIEGDIVAALHTVARITAADVGWLRKASLAALLLSLPRPPGRRGERQVQLRGDQHSLERDRAAVSFHYDLGNDFFAQFLDERMVYSCAYFADEDTDLETAQLRKLDTICRKLRLAPGQRFLDIGCGWGALALHAAQHYGVHAVGVTLARHQADLARERVRQAGLQDRVEIRVADYREVTGTFDAVASVGMVEHVGSAQLPRYFQTAWRLTAPGGSFLNHGITTGGRQQVRELSDDEGSFVGRYVFPDGALVPAWRACLEMERAGFELLDVQQLRPHYALTLREWVRRLEANHDAAVRAASEEAYRTWRAYMAGSVVGFETNDLGLVQVLGAKGAHAPLDRGYMRPDVNS